MFAKDTEFLKSTNRIFGSTPETLIMGILNVTDDSFFDGGKFKTEIKWLKQTEKMILEGADIIDIGAFSSRPNSKIIPAKIEEIKLIAVIESVRKKFPQLIISADTFRATAAHKAVERGANIINDISGGTMDNEMFDIVAKLNVPYILTHIKGTPQTMQNNPDYNNVVKEVKLFFNEQTNKLNSLGFTKIILDVGFGFGKTVENNFDLLSNLKEFTTMGYPLLAGISRKSMITKTLGLKTHDALNGTTVLNTVAMLKGARILRVHDVKEAKQISILLKKL